MVSKNVENRNNVRVRLGAGQVINQYVDSMNVMDSRSFRSFIEKNTPDLEMKGEFNCVHCGHKEEVDIPITVSFFWPDTE